MAQKSQEDEPSALVRPWLEFFENTSSSTVQEVVQQVLRQHMWEFTTEMADRFDQTLWDKMAHAYQEIWDKIQGPRNSDFGKAKENLDISTVDIRVALLFSSLARRMVEDALGEALAKALGDVINEFGQKIQANGGVPVVTGCDTKFIIGLLRAKLADHALTSLPHLG